MNGREQRHDSADLTDGELQRLLTTYQVERGDEQHTAALVNAYIATGLGFIAAATAFMASEVSDGFPPLMIVLAPVPAWILAGFVAFHVSASQLRQKFLMELEERLARNGAAYLRYPRFTTLHQGLYKPMAGRSGNHWNVALAWTTNLAPFAVIVAFTLYAVWWQAEWCQHDKLELPIKIAATLLYVSVAVVMLKATSWARHHAAELHIEAVGKFEEIRERHDLA